MARGIFHFDHKAGGIVSGPAPARGSAGSRWPITPEAMGISREDIPATEARLARKGIPTKYNKHGNPIITSRSHYRKICKELGFYHRNAGYGDPQPYNR